MTAITASEEFASTRFVNLGNPTVLDNRGPFWVVIYAKPTSQSEAGLGYLVSKCPANGQGWRIICNDGGGAPKIVAARSTSSSAILPERQAAANSVVYNSWQHYIISFEGAQGTTEIEASRIKIYTDDATEESYSASSDGVGTLNDDASIDLMIGNRFGLGRAFVGKLAYATAYVGSPTTNQINAILADGPHTPSEGVEAARIFTYVNAGIISGPQDASNTISIGSRSTYVNGSELPPDTDLGDGSGGLTINATPANAVASGVQASISRARTINATPGNAVATGVTATIVLGSPRFVTPALANNSGVPGVRASVAVSWYWFPLARVDELADVVMVDGTGTTEADGTFILTEDMAGGTGAGFLIVGELGASAALDRIFGGPGTIA